jgi:hypothetical protein
MMAMVRRMMMRNMVWRVMVMVVVMVIHSFLPYCICLCLMYCCSTIHAMFGFPVCFFSQMFFLSSQSHGLAFR